jgi:NADH-quinone oxidoreductase subunit E
MDVIKVNDIVAKYQGKEGVLIQVLQDIQAEYNWLPEEALKQVSQRLEVPLSQAYGIASFYKAFSLTPRGRHLLSVCLGTACHVRGGAKILDKVEELLGISDGETTEDMKFTLKRVNCLGCCALGPVMVVDGEYHGKLLVSKVGEILNSYD